MRIDVDGDGRDAIALTQALVRCPSVTPEEGGALDLLQSVLEAAGFVTQRKIFQAEGTPDVDNLYARYGKGDPCLLFAGHTDVVPTGDEALWTHPPFAGVIDKGILYGRGTTDMKGGVAASVSAALRFLDTHQDGFSGSIAFLITGDEEGPAVNGSVKLLQWAHEQGERWTHCILGEPTNPDHLGDMIKIGRRGSLTGRLEVLGKQGHVAYPALAINPISDLMVLMRALKDEPLDAGTDHFDPSNLEFTSVDVGNRASNVIPNSAKAVFNIRFNDLWTSASLEKALRARLEQAAGNRIRYEILFEPTNAEAFLTTPDPFVHKMAERVAALTGRPTCLSTTGGTSDARFIKNYCPVLEFGLVGQTMHQINERVETLDLETLAQIYEMVLNDYFAA
jgi:succinyl-diaminopimelate desuccinylase